MAVKICQKGHTFEKTSDCPVCPICSSEEMKNLFKDNIMKKYSTVDEYIATFPEEVQKKLMEIRSAIREHYPESKEKITYGIPTATLEGKYFIYFAGFKDHISLYPVTAAVENSLNEIEKYRTGKGTLQFALDEPLPMALINKIIAIRAKEHLDSLKNQK